MQSATPPMLKPALIAGLSAGIFVSIPLNGYFGAVTCCLGLAGCGFFAAFLSSKDAKQKGSSFLPGRGALTGLVSAVFFSLVVTIVAAVQAALSPENLFDKAMEQIHSDPNTPAEGIEMAEKIIGFFQDLPGFVLMLLLFVLWLVISGIFSAISGAIGGVVFKVEEEVISIQP